LIKAFEIRSKNLKYLGESFANIHDSDIVVVKNQGAFAFQDLKFIYALFFKYLKHDYSLNLEEVSKKEISNISKKIVRYKFFCDTDKRNNINISTFDNYLVPLNDIDLEKFHKLISSI